MKKNLVTSTSFVSTRVATGSGTLVKKAFFHPFVYGEGVEPLGDEKWSLKIFKPDIWIPVGDSPIFTVNHR